jgi:hypothetical protein
LIHDYPAECPKNRATTVPIMGSQPQIVLVCCIRFART